MAFSMWSRSRASGRCTLPSSGTRVERCLGMRWELVSPEQGDQTVRAHHLADAGGECRQERRLTCARKRDDGASARSDLDCPQYAHQHGRVLLLPACTSRSSDVERVISERALTDLFRRVSHGRRLRRCRFSASADE
jgi:hypothetical protein